MLDNDAADKIGDVVNPDDFYSDAHRIVYRHILQLIGDGKPADVVTVSEALSSTQKLDYVGGLAYLGALAQNVPTAANIRHYANIVRERSILRQLAATATEIAESAFNPLGRNAKMVLDEAEAKVLHIAEQGSRGAQNFQIIGKLLANVVERIETLYNRDDPSDVTGVPTGFAGSRPDDVRFPAGRPGRRRRKTEHGEGATTGCARSNAWADGSRWASCVSVSHWRRSTMHHRSSVASFRRARDRYIASRFPTAAHANAAPSTYGACITGSGRSPGLCGRTQLRRC